MRADANAITGDVLGVKVNAVSSNEIVQFVTDSTKDAEGRMVAVANVHMVMEARKRREFANILNSADLVVPDGAPLAWVLRQQGYPHQKRTSGPDLLPQICATAAMLGIPIGFYGGTKNALDQACLNLLQEFPALRIVCAISPPYRTLDDDEQQHYVSMINASGAKILFVALGCPKQEIWMNENRARINAVMLGMGAALDFTAGLTKRAPPWMQQNSLEWLYRVWCEPKRLYWRYLSTIPGFLFLTSASLLRRSWGLRG